MFIDKITLELMLRHYSNALIENNITLSNSFNIKFIDTLEENQNLIKQIERVLNGKEKIVIDKNIINTKL